MTFVLTSYQSLRECKGMFYSPSFYTHPQGYHLAILVVPNGHLDGEGTHVSVCAEILNGKYDSQLKWPFLGEVTVTLLNQFQDNGHHRKTIFFTEALKARAAGTYFGISTFMPHTQLVKYLDNDSLYFRVSVIVSNYKPWLQCGIHANSKD